MKITTQLFWLHLLFVSSFLVASDDETQPLLGDYETTEEAASSSDISAESTSEFGDLEFHFQHVMSEWTSTSVDWAVSLANGSGMRRVHYPNKSRIWFRVPPKAIIPPHTSKNRSKYYRVDFIIYGIRPGWLGQTPLGRFLKINQNMISFPVSFFFDHTGAKPVDRFSSPGMTLYKDGYMSVDEKYPTPVLNLQLRPYHEVVALLKERNQKQNYRYQPLKEFAEFDEEESEDRPVTDKSETGMMSREELRYAEMERQLNQQMQKDEQWISALLMLIASGQLQAPQITDEGENVVLEWALSPTAH